MAHNPSRTMLAGMQLHALKPTHAPQLCSALSTQHSSVSVLAQYVSACTWLSGTHMLTACRSSCCFCVLLLLSGVWLAPGGCALRLSCTAEGIECCEAATLELACVKNKLS